MTKNKKNKKKERMTIAQIQKSKPPAFPPHQSKTKDHWRLNSLGAGGIEYVTVFIFICHLCCPVFLMGQSKAGVSCPLVKAFTSRV
jgi:hypothetical protein